MNELVDALFDELMSRGARSDRSRDETILIGKTPYLFSLNEFTLLASYILQADDLKAAYQDLQVPDAEPEYDYDLLSIGESRYRFSFRDFKWLAIQLNHLVGDGSALAEVGEAEEAEASSDDDSSEEDSSDEDSSDEEAQDSDGPESTENETDE